MSKTPSTSHIDKLKEQRAKLDARIQAAEARRKNVEHKMDTRRKILVGAYYWEQAIQHHQLEELKQKMAAYLTRESDRKLFNLPTLETEVEV